jgi:hypothetical protein
MEEPRRAFLEDLLAGFATSAHEFEFRADV